MTDTDEVSNVKQRMQWLHAAFDKQTDKSDLEPTAATESSNSLIKDRKKWLECQNKDSEKATIQTSPRSGNSLEERKEE